MLWWLKLLSGEHCVRWIAVGLSVFACASVALCASLIAFSGEDVELPLSMRPGIVKNLSHDFEGELIFNSEFGQTPFTDLLSELSEAATESICAAQFSFRHPDLFRNVSEQSSRGVDVALIVAEERRERLLEMLDEKGLSADGVALNCAVPEPKSHMHHKLWLFDRDGACPVTVFGSWNPTEAQEWFDPSFMLRTSDSDVVAIISEEYDRIQSGLSGNRKFSDDDYASFAAKLCYRNGDLEIWQSPGLPGDGLKQRILHELSTAKQSIDLIMWYFNDVEILQALHRCVVRGVEVRLLLEDSTARKSRELVAFASRDDVEVITDAMRTAVVATHPKNSEEDFNPYLHQHLAIIDGKTVINGSANWTRSGFQRNDELSFVTNIPWLVNEFACQFHALYCELTRDRSVTK